MERRRADGPKRERSGHRGPNKDRKRGNGGEGEEFKVDDRRHWMLDEEPAPDGDETESAVRQPSVVDEYRRRAEEAETKLQEYIAAFKGHQQEQDRFRTRLEADVDRKVELKFGELVAELLQTVDDLNLGLSHVEGVAEAEPLAQGVTMARDRFLATLERHGIEEITPDGETFDPNEAEAIRVTPVESEDLNDIVTETLQRGYRLGDRVIRAARVAVGRYGGA